MKILWILLVGLVFAGSAGCSAKGSLDYIPPPATSPVSTRMSTKHSVAEVLAAAAAYAEDNGYRLAPADAGQRSVSFHFETREPLQYIDCGVLISKFTSKSGRKRDLTTPAAAERYNLKYVEGKELIDEHRNHHLACTVMVSPRPEGDHTAVDVNVRYSLEGVYMRQLAFARQSWKTRVVFMSRAPSDKAAPLQCRTSGALEQEIFRGIMAMLPQDRAAAQKRK